MPFAFVNALLCSALADKDAILTAGGEGKTTPYMMAVRDALRTGGCNASRSSLVGACVAASTVSCGWSTTTPVLLPGGVPLSWIERVWCAEHVLSLIGSLGCVRAAIFQRSGASPVSCAKL